MGEQRRGDVGGLIPQGEIAVSVGSGVGFGHVGFGDNLLARLARHQQAAAAKAPNSAASVQSWPTGIRSIPGGFPLHK